MNDNPEGTPNPLNPTPGEAPLAAPEAAPQPMATEQPIVAEQPAVEAPAPADTTATVPKPKKGKGGIIAAITCGIIALGCGVAAILVLFVFNKSGNPVSDALIKLINNENRNIAASGKVEATVGTYNFSANFSASFDTVAKAGTLSVSADGALEGTSSNVSMEARVAGDNELFVKIDGIKNAMFSSMGIDCSTTDCDQYIELYSALGGSYVDTSIEYLKIDGKWIKMGTSASSIISLPGGSSIDDINANKNKIIELYKKYPFISYTTDNLSVQKKNDTLYKLDIDYDKLASFYSEYASKTVSSSEVKDIFKLNGDIYVEIDSNNNFTRLYATGNSFVDLDVTFTYPTTVNVEKPTEYETSDILDSLLKGFNFGGGSYSYSYGDDDDDYDYDIDYDNGGYDYNDDGSWTYPIDDDDYDWSWIYDDEDSNVAN